MLKGRMTRRRFLATTAAATAVAMPYVRGAHAAGKLSIGFWDHWVPGANNASTALVKEWAAKEKVEVSDRLHHLAGQQEPADHRRRGAGALGPRHPGHSRPGSRRTMPSSLEPVDDIMERADQAERRRQSARSNISARPTASWLAVPATIGSQIKGPCSRIDLMKQHAGIDVQAMYPAGVAAEGGQLDARHLPQGGGSLPQGRLPFGIGLGHDRGLGRHRRARFFQSFGAELVDAKGNITVKTDAVRQALEYYKQARAVLCRRTRRPGTTPPTTSGWSPARAR